MVSSDRSARLGVVFAVTNQKGGVAKSTTCINTASALTKMGYKVLVGDLDPQGDASDGMGIDTEVADKTVYEALRGDADIHEAITTTPMADLLIGSGDLASAEMEFQQLGKEQMVRKAIEGLRSEYDFMFLDTPPSLGWCTINALTAADYLVIPSNPAKWSNKALVTLNKTLQMIWEFTNKNLQVAGIIVTNVDKRTNSAKTNQALADIIGNQLGYPVFQTYISRSAKVEDSQTDCFDLLDKVPRCKPSMEYREFAQELVNMVEGAKDNG